MGIKDQDKDKSIKAVLDVLMEKYPQGLRNTDISQALKKKHGVEKEREFSSWYPLQFLKNMKIKISVTSEQELSVEEDNEKKYKLVFK